MKATADTPNFPSMEWLETDGLGGFASNTVRGIRSRRYHGLLLTATQPSTGRVMLVNGFEAWIETPRGRFSLSSQHYAPNVLHPEVGYRLLSFTDEPWPTWHFRFADGTEVIQEIFIARSTSTTVLSWRLKRQQGPVRLFVRPLVSGRDYHSLHRFNQTFDFTPTHLRAHSAVRFRPYPALPGIRISYSENGQYKHEPAWYYQFLYEEEASRGLDCIEDLASPGIFEWDLSSGSAVWLLKASQPSDVDLPEEKVSVRTCYDDLRKEEWLRRARFLSPLHRAADAYLVTGRAGKTILAGYPWFTDWGRDTFIALRGLCLATNRLTDAKDILLAWTHFVSEGMLPNRFPDLGERPEYNSVDASLWFVIAVHEFLQISRGKGLVSTLERAALQRAVEEILSGYAKGTRFGIRMDSDGLLLAGESGTQLTWMDAKVGDWVVTPRIGKPVEVQALWLNALKLSSSFSTRWEELYSGGLRSFRRKFWNAEAGCLFDVVDVDRQPGQNDAAIRPNQILAVGGLPFTLLEEEEAKHVVDVCEKQLLTPVGLRSLAPGAVHYQPYYQGGVHQRDGAYHQGTVWPWLIGPFVEAWVRVHGNNAPAKAEARHRFLGPLMAHLDKAGIGHVSEILDAEEPHVPRGCPWQAWSVGELIRLDRTVLAPPRTMPRQTKLKRDLQPA